MIYSAFMHIRRISRLWTLFLLDFMLCCCCRCAARVQPPLDAVLAVAAAHGCYCRCEARVQPPLDAVLAAVAVHFIMITADIREMANTFFSSNVALALWID